MKLQKVTCSQATRFGGSKAEAAVLRREMMNQYDIKIAAVTIEEFDVGAGKAGVLDALNRLADMLLNGINHGDDVDGEGDE